jgi:hypothetical protein
MSRKSCVRRQTLKEDRRRQRDTEADSADELKLELRHSQSDSPLGETK